MNTGHVDELLSIQSDSEGPNNNRNSPLISIWIPSVFLRTNKSDTYHVYQVK